MSKNILTSKTFWFGVIQFAMGGLTGLQAQHSDWSWVVMVMGLLTMILRTFTTQPVHIGEAQ